MIHTKIMRNQQGFSLIEMAIVLFIVALLLGGLLPTISSQIDQKNISNTRKQLDEIQQALLGFAIINGRLPCPASNNSNGLESFCSDIFPAACVTEVYFPVAIPPQGRCYKQFNGLIPAVTLGITPVDSSGKMLDGWNNPIHYAVTDAQVAGVHTYTAFPSQMSTVGIAALFPNLYVCASSPDPVNPSNPQASCLTAIKLADKIPAVIYSTGSNGGHGGNGIDELANANSFLNPHASPNSYEDPVFVSHDPTSIGAPNGEFDDIVVWISPNILINRMVAAGKLP